MAIIDKIKVGGTTYDVSDSIARTSLVRTLTFAATDKSSEYAANTRYSRFLVTPNAVSTSPKYASCLFACYRAKIERTQSLNLWTQIQLEGVYRNSGNTADDGYGLVQKITAIGKCNGNNGPATYWLHCCDNLNIAKNKWTFYISAGLKYKVVSHNLALYFFNYPNALTASSFVTTQSAWTSF